VGEGSRAFLKGGAGCVVAFIVIGIAVAALGGRAHADLGGLAMLFVIGGVIGLAALAFRGGRKPRAGPWTCASCGAPNVAEMRGCVACGEPRP
jgi:hypothetical protein